MVLIIIIAIIVALIVYKYRREESVNKVSLKSSSFQFPIAGINYRSGVGQYVSQDWTEAYEAVLVLEPNNPHDSNAIRVEIKGNNHHVGYVSKTDQEQIRSLCPAFPYECQVHISARQGYDKTYYDGIIII